MSMYPYEQDQWRRSYQPQDQIHHLQDPYLQNRRFYGNPEAAVSFQPLLEVYPRRQEGMSGHEFARKGVLGVAITLSLIGMGLTIAAILTPSWQVVNLREYNSIHEHGLWLDCTRHSRDGNHILQRYATVTEPLHCVYKFDYDKYSGTFDMEDDNSPVGEASRHKFYGWHTSTLILLGLCLITCFLSTCLGLCGCCYSSLSLVFTALTVLTTIMSSTAVGIFFFFSHRADNRFIKGIVGTYEQRVGLAFFLQLTACFFHFFSALAAGCFTFLSFSGKPDPAENYSLQRSSRTNVTNIGRSMEFDAPLIYPPHTPLSHIRKQEEYDRHVGESMPELGRGPFPANDFFPNRVRRKSETCV